MRGPEFPPSTEYGKSQAPWFIILNIAFAVIMIGRFWMLDIWNGFMSLITLCIGCAMVSWEMHILWVTIYMAVNLTNTIFDLIYCIIAVVRTKPDWTHFFDEEKGWVYNFLHGCILAAPICSFIATRLACAVFSEHHEREAEFLYQNQPALGRDPFGGGYGGAGYYDRPPPRRYDDRPDRRQHDWGSGRRLGDEEQRR